MKKQGQSTIFLVALALAALIAGCAGGPPSPDWQLDARAALLGFEKHYLEGSTRLADAEFARAIKKCAPKLILFKGAATEKLMIELEKIKYNKILGVVTSMKDALRIAHGEAKRRDVVLLSPGAASFGIFKNEFDRGDQFSALVRRLNTK